MKKYLQIALIFALLSISTCVFAEVGQWWEEMGAPSFDPLSDSPLITAFPSGLIIDWQGKAAVMTGRCAITGPMTIENRDKITQTAKQEALKALIDSIGALRIDGFTTLSDLFESDPGLQTEVDSIIKKAAQVVHEKVLSQQGILEVEIKMPLMGKAGLTGTIFPRTLPKLPILPPTPPSTTEISGPAYSGLIIDASGLGIQGGLSPRIYSEDGKELFSLQRDSNRTTAILSGIIDYAPKNSDSDEALKRAGENPLQLVAEGRMKSPYGCDILVSLSDAKKIIEADKASNFIKELKVVIIL